ncbi:hypothetical protein NE865_16149 [Phthorimaea operculella]|nr:hypothetical protein NE865_16149 [Phthorimaea operculella]
MNPFILSFMTIFALSTVGSIIFVISWTSRDRAKPEDPEGTKWSPALRVRFGRTNFGEEYFIPLPIYASDAKYQGWTQENRPDYDVMPILTLYCHGSKIICVLYDDTEYVAGLQVAFPEDEFEGAIFNWEIQGYSKWNASDGKSYWAIQQYYVYEGFLEIDPQERESGRDPTHLLQAWRSVWARGNYRGRIEIFQWGHESEEISGFTQQACIPMMGNHYWRLTLKRSVTMSCSWFALYDSDNEIIGTGLQAFGRFPVAEVTGSERPSKEEVQAIVSNGPECIPDLAENPGLVTIHIYYIDTPWDVVC